MSKVMVGRHYLVSGRVQGVGFRRYVYKQALELGISGKVRNLFDGRVEVLALGSSEMISEFEKRLSKGPSFSSVSDLSSKTVDETARVFKALAGFSILEDGGAPWRVD